MKKASLSLQLATVREKEEGKNEKVAERAGEDFHVGNL